MKNWSIRTKIMLGVLVVNVIGILVVMVYLHQSYSGGLDVTASKSLSLSSTAWTNIQELETRKLASVLYSLEANPTWQAQFAAKNRSALTASTESTFEQLKGIGEVTHWYFETEDGKVFLRAHKPEQFDDEIDRPTYIKAKETDALSAGLDLGKNAIALRVVAPYTSESGSKIGFMEVGQEVDGFLARMKKETGDDYVLLLDKTNMDAESYAEMREANDLANNWDERENYVVAGATSDAAEQFAQFDVPSADVPDTGKVVGIENGACSKLCHGGMKGEGGDYWAVRWSQTEGKSSAHSVFPVTDVSGNQIGIVYGIEDISKQADSAKSSLVRTLVVIVSGLILAFMFIAWMLSRYVFSRLNRMITSMEEISIRVAGGDFTAHFEPDGSGDEIGKFEGFFAKFMDLMANTLKMLTK